MYSAYSWRLEIRGEARSAVKAHARQASSAERSLPRPSLPLIKCKRNVVSAWHHTCRPGGLREYRGSATTTISAWRVTRLWIFTRDREGSILGANNGKPERDRLVHSRPTARRLNQLADQSVIIIHPPAPV